MKYFQQVEVRWDEFIPGNFSLYVDDALVDSLFLEMVGNTWRIIDLNGNSVQHYDSLEEAQEGLLSCLKIKAEH